MSLAQQDDVDCFAFTRNDRYGSSLRGAKYKRRSNPLLF